ncbi:hypothetical protein DES53_104384 [Roseimicrobium gellanilyticum]|uniref:Uncharacterized protein n=1 Tax=Roseimicrobium gellanilyticum TaxID=748857 RepID=A0A366HNF8_9BACT|nr:hypothetical protein [Roseimicrobium gellanilyticum]RBP44563.1 hypothetical protein DES53_104384 [Roseimicrobium gellanilyticum]
MLRHARTLVFFIALGAAGWFLYAHRNDKENEYCTTYSYGSPFPWRIENCECDGRGGLTEYPMDSVVWNLSLALAGAFGISRLVPRRDSAS